MRFFPELCVVCSCMDHSQSGLCPDCAATMPWQAPGCLRCGIETRLNFPTELPVCQQCLDDPPAFNSCHTVFDYCSPVVELVSRFKYGAGFAEGRVLARLLCQSLREFYTEGELPEILVPVPSHRSRLRRRGFNQAIELARVVSRHTGIALSLTDCQRVHASKAQRGLSAQERRQNMVGAFSLHRNRHLRQYRRLAIIDDVVTTTATVHELARCLRHDEGQRIDVWAVARVN
ncbi:MAG: ComF family protein [Pseudomonadales bacterium]|nr:ComF family protein [Pseudomonadales bacterium]